MKDIYRSATGNDALSYSRIGNFTDNYVEWLEKTLELQRAYNKGVADTKTKTETMITPKEKAEDLIRKFFPDLKESLDLELVGTRKAHAKRCALICQEEIYDSIPDENWNDVAIQDFWIKVRLEIEKL